MTPSMLGKNPSPSNRPALTPTLVRLSLAISRSCRLRRCWQISQALISSLPSLVQTLPSSIYSMSKHIDHRTHADPSTQHRVISRTGRPGDSVQSRRGAGSLYVKHAPVESLLHISTGGRLEDALTYYKRSKDFGVERAAVHIRNVRSSSSTRLMVAPEAHQTPRSSERR
jgi:hypothetical protein